MIIENPSSAKYLTRPRQKNMVEILFAHLIRWYPQISLEGRDTYALGIEEKIEHHEISQDAIRSLREAMQRGESKESMKKLLHYEHNVPVDMVKKRLLELLNNSSADFESIKRLMDSSYEVILISKAEESMIRRLGFTKTGTFDERMNAAGISLCDIDLKMQFLRALRAYNQ
jgi:hypothetical protein